MSRYALVATNALIALAFVGALAAFAQTADTTPPVISGVGVSGISQTAATVGWTTDEPADSQVEYGTSTAYGLSSTLGTATTTAHSVSLSGLTASTTYHFIVKSRDVAGNLATSTDYSFTTLAAPPADTMAPVISAVSVSGVTQTTAQVNWTTNEPSDSQVQYGTSTSYGTSSALQTALVTAHSTALSSLTASTTYHFMAMSRDAAGNLATSSDGTFTTLTAPATTTPPTTADVTVSLKVAPKTINAKSKGKWVEVRVTFPEGYDARDVNMSSIKLNGTLSPERVKIKAKKQKKHDDDDDDDDDRESWLHMKFSRSALIGLLAGGTTATSTATTTDSRFVEKQLTITGTIGIKTFGGSTTVRFRPAIDLPNGLVLRAEDGSEVYIIVNGKKRHIPNPQAFQALGLSWGNVQVVARSVIDSSEDEALIKSVDNPKVYLISGGKKRHVTDPAAFEAQGLDWEDIMVVSAKELSFYSTVSGITLMRASGDAKVYFISGGVRQWVPSESVFTRRGFKWEDIVIVDESERDRYKEGAKLD